MAVNKTTKTATTKTAAKAKVQEVQEVQEVQAQEVKPQRKVRKEIDRNAMIPCRNVTNGNLIYISSKTGLTTKWNELNDEEYLEFAELLTMKSSQPRFLTEPWIIVDDEEVAEYMGLHKIYENMFPIDEIESMFRLPVEEIEEILTKAPRGFKSLVADKARELIANDELYDVRVIRLLDKMLDIDLTMIQD